MPGATPTVAAAAAGGRPWTRWTFWLSLVFPVVVLALVFSQVDLHAMLQSLWGANLVEVLGTLALAFLIPIVLLAWRWQWILRRFYGANLSYGCILREYWISLFVGYWLPAGVGSDVYRVIRVSKAAGGIPVSAAAVVGEKAWALLAYGLLVLGAYPLVIPSVNAQPQVRQGVMAIAAVAALATAALLLVLLLKGPLARQVRSALQGRVLNRLSGMARALLRAAGGGEAATFSGILAPFFRWRNQAVGLGLTLLIQLITSVGGRLLLLALGVNLPLAVHVFVWALMNFFLFLPITVAGFGVREASFILLFGLFGVPRETALAASFLSLGCTLIAIGPGGLVLLWRGLGPRTRGAASPTPGP